MSHSKATSHHEATNEPSQVPGATISESQLIAIVKDYVEAIEAGATPNRAQLLREHAEIADELNTCLDGLDFLHHAAAELVDRSQPAAETTLPQRELGDFRILRELGRGGMGVVYEAEQLSLGRRVALKVLPFAAMLDKRHLERFKNEARAAAVLKHPNIVSVYSVGHDRGVHFYAMELVAGDSLARVIEPLGGNDDIPILTKPVDTSIDTKSIAALSTEYSHDRPAYYRTVARWGIQIAAALDYAHQQGVVHRDIKPSNLLLDHDGQLWISDFGLAQIQDDHNLTMTGDMLGTLRYMSPEQAEGKKYIDHRTDVYSLGVTLYELLTLQAAFPGPNQQQLLRQVTEQQPDSLRKRDRGIPQDLDTIVLKAMAKRPEARFDTAQELADDLQRYLENKPIKARRTTRSQVAWQWACRNPLIAILLGTVLSLLLLLSIGGPLVAVRYARMNDDNVKLSRAAEEARQEAILQLYVSDMQSAQAAWERGNIERVRELLVRHVPELGHEDLRGFEWYLLWGRYEAAVGTSVFSIPSTGPTIRFSPDGTIIACRGHGVVALWDVATKVKLREFEMDVQQGVLDIAFSPAGDELACAITDHTVRLWDVESGSSIATLKHIEQVRSVAYSPDGNILAAGAGYWELGGIRLWDAHTHVELATLSGHTGGIESLAFSPDGSILASGGRDRTVKLWDVTSRSETDTLIGHKDGVDAVVFSPDGQILASSEEWGSVKLWDVATRTLLTEIDEPLKQVVTLDFSPYAQTLALAGQDGRVWLWNSATQALRRLPGSPSRVNSLAFSPNGETLACGCRDGAIRFVKSATLVPPDGTHIRWWTRIAFSPVNDNLLAVASGEMDTRPRFGEVMLWDLAKDEGRLLTELDSVPITSIAFSPDGTVFATGSESRRSLGIPADVVLWDATTGERLRRITSHKSTVYGLAFSPDGKTLASGEWGETVETQPVGDWGGQVKLSDVATGKELASHRLDRSTAVAIAFSPDGGSLAVGGGRWNKGSLKVWSLVDDADPITLAGHKWMVWKVAFSSGGSSLASVGWDGTIRLWDVMNGEMKRTTNAHRMGLLSVAFSPDGKTLASAGTDENVKLWHMTTGDELMSLPVDVPLCSIAFTSDGKSLAAAGFDKSIRVWGVDGSERVLRYPYD